MPLRNAPAFHFDTRDYPDGVAFESWREVMSATHDVGPGDDTPDGFQVSCTIWPLGQAMVSSGRFESQTFARTEPRVRHDQFDQYGLFVQGDGWRVSQTLAGEDVLRRGDIHIFDFTQPETSFASAGTSGSLYLPRDLVDAVIPDFGRFNGMVLRDGAARLLAQHILALGQHFDQIPADAMPGVAKATLDLAFGTLAGLAAGDTGFRPVHEPALRRQVERYIDANLGDRNLAVDSICAAFGISRATLYRLFEAHDGVATYVKQRRLTRIRAILLANEDPRSLAEIALDFGFTSGGHFTREFRRTFGCTPSEVRMLRSVATSQDPAPDMDLNVVFRLLLA